MPRYAITEKAGRFVAGQTNPGAGTVLELTEKQAEHEVRLGTLKALDAPPAPEPAPEAAQEAAGEAQAPAGGATPKKGKKAAPAPAPEADKGAGAE